MKMLAAVYYGPHDLRIEDREAPSISADEMLLRVNYASICATDLRILHGHHRKFGAGTVRIPGHEIFGTIEQLGRAVLDYHVGDRIFIAPNIGCGSCPQCRVGQNNLCPSYEAFGITLDGGFAEYMRIPAAAIKQGNAIRIDQQFDGASVALAEPLACVLHGQDKIGLGKEDTVLIEGAGPIGLMHLLLARLRGASRIIVSDHSSFRLTTARALSADRVIDFEAENLSDAVSEETDGRGVDVVIVTAANRTAFETAIHQAAPGARINFFAGLPKENSSILLDANQIHYKEIIVTGSTGCSTSECRRAADLVASGDINLKPLITGRFPLSQILEAIEASKDRNGLKVIIESHLNHGQAKLCISTPSE